MSNFTWTDSGEPHAIRRQRILERYPQIKKLYGPEWRTIPIVFSLVTAQIIFCYLIKLYDPSWPLLIASAWIISGTINHTLQLAVHEVSHNLACKTELGNRLLAIFANLPTVFASAITFSKYHMEHHGRQGTDGIDTDIATDLEVRIFSNTFMKILWIALQPFFYAFRPIIIRPKPVGLWEVFNWVCSISFDLAIVYFFGSKALCYLIAGTLLGLGLHPASGHFIAEHFTFNNYKNDFQETYAYKGICNYLNFNVGKHVVHHDFPWIPWSRLDQVEIIAPEFYKDMKVHTSYLKVYWDFVTNPQMGPGSRIKRKKQSSDSIIRKSSNTFMYICCIFMITAICYVLCSIFYSN
jgi:sphingolipid delta-4 desaturase